MTIDTTPSRVGQLMEEALRVAPGGVNSGRRKIQPPLCIARADGAYLEGLDGRRYLDYHAAWGAIVLGHCDPRVMEPVATVMKHLDLVGVGTTEGEVELAQKLVCHVPSVEQVLLCNSGTEATFHAVRLARAATGRPKLVKFAGCYHGFHDYVLAGSAEEGGPQGGASPRPRERRSAGVLSAAAEATLVCQYNDLASVERAFADNPGEIAAIILEPCAHNAATIIPAEGFLEGLRAICDREGTVLIFDEVITGFRHHLGGYQAIVGISPDLTTMAKAIANGFPIAAVGGKRTLMQRFSTSPDGDVFVGGTFNGNPMSVAAALATIEALEDGAVHEHTARLGNRMRTGLADIARSEGVPATIAGFRSVFVLCFMAPPLASYDDFLRNDAERFVRYRRALVERGIFEMPDHIGCRSHISAAHTDADIDRTLDAAADALRATTERGHRR